MQWLSVAFWRLLAFLFILLGFIGLLLPVMPTVPFLIVALWAASKGWPALEAKLLGHPKYGADIRAWRENRSIRRSAKWAATLMMSAGYIVLWFIDVSPMPLKVVVGMVLLLAAIWIWSRPEEVTLDTSDIQ
ncbi:MAG: YbaN family protein [Pseudomonadota bacterium]